MRVGDYLYCKNSIIKDIKSGDGVVGTFEPKRGETYQIIEMTKRELCINFKGHSIWFLLNDENDTGYFCEWYKKYFDELRIERKNKLEQISELWK